MKNILLLFFFSALSCYSAIAQTLELKFDDTHTVYYVPKGKMWLLDFEKTDKQLLSTITIDKMSTLAVLDEVFKTAGHAKRSIIVSKSVQVKLNAGESLIITVDEEAAAYTNTIVQANGNLFQGEGFRKDCCPLLQEPRKWDEK